MNTIEDRIRAAARAAADTVPPGSVPPLRLPAGRGRGRPGWMARWHRSAQAAAARWGGLLAPVAAGAAVAGLVIGLMNISRPESSMSSSASAPGGITASPPLTSIVASGQVPPYYVAITTPGNPNLHPSYAVVRATVNGKTLATIGPTVAGSTIVAVTAAADDRTFVLGEQDWARGSGDQWRQAITFYQFRLSPAGQPGTLSRLPMHVPAGDMMTGLALSPDGTKLAIAIRLGPDVQAIMLYPVGGGAARVWSGHGAIGAAFDTRSLSWPASQRTLAFDWTSNQSTSVRLLDLGTAGGSLLAESRLATSLGSRAQGPGGTLTFCPGNSIITPNGSEIVCAASQILHIGEGGTTRQSTGFAEFSTATGRITRILANWPSGPAGPTVMDVLWSGFSGRVLIGAIRSEGRLRVGVISGNQFTPVPIQLNPAAPDFGTW
jgi:hypothetical protein